MNRQFFDYEQGSSEWFDVRRGIVTASCFDAVMANGKGGAESKMRRKYMLTLIGERLTGETAESYSNGHMERGKVMEAEARDLYSFTTGNEIKQVGFIKLGDDIGASPDGLIGDPGCLEVKTKQPHLHLDCLLRDEVPSEHLKQIQGQLWVSDREWCDFVSYWPGLKIFIKRVNRDVSMIAKIYLAVDEFLDELHELMEKVK
jgi:predicted phage-related endonuclease